MERIWNADVYLMHVDNYLLSTKDMLSISCPFGRDINKFYYRNRDRSLKSFTKINRF